MIEKKLDVINVFWGALLSVWIVERFSKYITENWGFSISIVFGYGMIAYLLNRGIMSYDIFQKRILYYLIAFLLSFVLTFISCSFTEPNMLISAFTFTPGTWFLFVITIFWALSSELFRWKSQ